MNLVSFVEILPPSLRFFFVKWAYHRNGKKLQNLFRRQGGRFWLFKVGGIYMASQKLGWFLDFKVLQTEAVKIPLWHYRLQPGDSVVDLGAGLGEEAIVFSQLVGSAGVVHCIEANPNVFAVLKEVVERNGTNNVQLHHFALANQNVPVSLEDNVESYLSSAQASGKPGNARIFEVPGKTLEAFLEEKQLQGLDFLKCNIEGAERFLISSDKFLLARIRNMAISCHDFRYRKEGVEFYKTRNLIESHLTQNGFRVFSQQTGIDFIDDWVYAERIDF